VAAQRASRPQSSADGGHLAVGAVLLGEAAGSRAEPPASAAAARSEFDDGGSFVLHPGASCERWHADSPTRAEGAVEIQLRGGDVVRVVREVSVERLRACDGGSPGVLTLPPSVRVFVARGRRTCGWAWTASPRSARSRLGLDPLSGHLILFRNRRGDRLRSWCGIARGSGALQAAREGTFSWPRSSVEGRLELRTSELLLLLSGGDITRPRRTNWYDRLSEIVEEGLATTPFGAEIVRE